MILNIGTCLNLELNDEPNNTSIQNTLYTQALKIIFLGFLNGLWHSESMEGKIVIY